MIWRHDDVFDKMIWRVQWSKCDVCLTEELACPLLLSSSSYVVTSKISLSTTNEFNQSLRRRYSWRLFLLPASLENLSEVRCLRCCGWFDRGIQLSRGRSLPSIGARGLADAALSRLLCNKTDRWVEDGPRGSSRTWPSYRHVFNISGVASLLPPHPFCRRIPTGRRRHSLLGPGILLRVRRLLIPLPRAGGCRQIPVAPSTPRTTVRNCWSSF